VSCVALAYQALSLDLARVGSCNVSDVSSTLLQDANASKAKG